MKITNTIRKKYLKNPDNCPFCESTIISARHIDTSYNQAWREIECDKCGKEWREIFTITDIEPINV